MNCWSRTIRSGDRSRVPSRKTSEAPRTPEVRKTIDYFGYGDIWATLRPSLPESIAEWEAEMALIEKRDEVVEESSPSTPLMEGEMQVRMGSGASFLKGTK